jgi:uncharacterized protein (DUF2141 family)
MESVSMNKHILNCLSLAVIVALALISSRAANAAEQVALTSDIALQKSGVLHGQFVDKAGKAQADESVVIAQKGKPVVIVKTDKQGRINIRGLRPGTYQIETAKSSGTYRLWATGTAPPKAKSGFLAIAEGTAVRAQLFNGQYGSALHGAIIGGLIVGGTYWALDRPGT